MMICRRHPPGLFSLFLFILLLSPGCGGGGDPEPGQNDQKPLAITNAATSTTTSTSTLNGNANPNGQATAEHFEWGQDPNLVGAAQTPDQAIGNGIASVAITAPLSSLTASTKYYYRVVATSTAGTSNGSIASFTTATPDAPPTVNTLGTTGITTGGVTLNGNAIPNGLATVAHFEWGQDLNLVGATPTPDQGIGNGVTSVFITFPLSGLTASTTYRYRVVATSMAGTSNGSIASFTTATPDVPPTVQTLGATGITTGGATLNGSANPNGLATTAHFEWGQDPTLVGAATTTDQAVGSGSASVSISAPFDVLTASTTYYYRVVATNSAGTSTGTILSFTTSSFGTGTFTYNPSGHNARVTTGDSNTVIFNKLFPPVTNYSGVFSLDFSPTAEYGSGGYISIRLSDTPTTYFQFSTKDALVTKVRKGVVVDSAAFPFPYNQGSNYPIKITFSQIVTTFEAFGGTVSLTSNISANPIIYFEVETTQQDAFYDNIKLETGNPLSEVSFDDFSTDTTGTYSVY